MEKQKNKEYEAGKKLVAEYIEKMNGIYKDTFQRLMNDMDEDSEFESIEAVKFIRTWDIIMNDITEYEKNLFCTYSACDSNAYKCLDIFNGKGNNIKNIFSIRAMIYTIKKKINKIYNEKYNVKHDT